MEVVWIEHQKCWGWLVQRASSYVIVQYELDGIEYSEVLDPDEITEPKDMGINYESDS
jgi:hypothetical protein